MKDKTVFVDIDTQFDFMDPSGNLYVPGAEDIVDNIKKLFEYAKGHKIKILSSTDAHTTKLLQKARAYCPGCEGSIQKR